MEPDESHIGTRIRQARLAAGLSQDELGVRTALRGMTISRYELGVFSPGASALAKLARTLGVSIDWLVTGEGAGPLATPPGEPPSAAPPATGTDC